MGLEKSISMFRVRCCPCPTLWVGMEKDYYKDYVASGDMRLVKDSYKGYDASKVCIRLIKDNYTI